MMREAIFRVGARVRNSGIARRYESLRSSERWPRERLVAEQEAALVRFVAWAHERSPFHRERLDRAGVAPSDVRRLADLERLPVLEKADLLAHRERIQVRDGLGKLFFSETSGSTGEPLVFHRDLGWDAATRAAMFRGYAWHGVRPWDRNGLLWGYDIAADRRARVRVLDELQNRFRLFSYDPESVRRFAHRLVGATYLEGYSSMVYEVARILNREPPDAPLDLRMVKGTSETILPGYQDEVRRAFGRKMISEYGSAETGIIAFECPEGGQHVAMENVIVEVVDGQAIVTNLFSRSFPILRYRLGDAVELADESTPCGCGMEHQRLAAVVGRLGQVVHGRERTYPSLSFYYVFKNVAMRHGEAVPYQAIQERAGELELRIEGGIEPERRALLEVELRKYFGDDLTWTFTDAPRHREPGKKLRDFVSRVGS